MDGTLIADIKRVYKEAESHERIKAGYANSRLVVVLDDAILLACSGTFGISRLT
jgi:hypothetical protein